MQSDIMGVWGRFDGCRTIVRQKLMEAAEVCISMVQRVGGNTDTKKGW